MRSTGAKCTFQSQKLLLQGSSSSGRRHEKSGSQTAGPRETLGLAAESEEALLRQANGEGQSQGDSPIFGRPEAGATGAEELIGRAMAGSAAVAAVARAASAVQGSATPMVRPDLMAQLIMLRTPSDFTQPGGPFGLG